MRKNTKRIEVKLKYENRNQCSVKKALAHAHVHGKLKRTFYKVLHQNKLSLHFILFRECSIAKRSFVSFVTLLEIIVINCNFVLLQLEHRLNSDHSDNSA